MATLDEILATRDLATLDKTTHRLPALVEATLPAAIGAGVANGLAKLNGSGVPITAAGVPMAVIGTAAGQAADAAATTTAVNAAATTANTASTNAANALVAATAANSNATAASTAAASASAAVAGKISTPSDASRVPEIRQYTAKPSDATLLAAGIPAGALIVVSAATT